MEGFALIQADDRQDLMPRRQPEEAESARIGFQNVERIAADQKHGFVGPVEQAAVAALDLPQFPIFLLDGLLGRG